MSALDALMNYDSRLGYRSSNIQSASPSSSDIFDNLPSDIDASLFSIEKETGRFLRAIHKNGFSVVGKAYYDEDGNKINANKYNSLSDDEKLGYTEKIELSELCKVITTPSDQLVISSAGSGKTTVMIFKIIYDMLSGETMHEVSHNGFNPIKVPSNIFVGTFLKSGAEELQKRLGLELEKYGYTDVSSSIQFSTLHAEFKHAMEAMNIPIKIGSQEDLSSMLKESVKAFDVKRIDGASLSVDDWMNIQTILAYTRGRLDNQKYNHPMCKEYDNMTPFFIDKILEKYKRIKEIAGVVDFEDLQELLYKFLYITPNSAVQDFIANRYRFMYLDEFQDTSQIQYAILKFYMRGRLKINKLNMVVDESVPSGLSTGIEGDGKFVCVGDDDQCIYKWRGSDINIICEDFDKDFMPCFSELSCNYRCPENVLAPVIPSIKLNTKRFDKDLKAYKTGGEFHAYEVSSIQNMVDKLITDVDKDMAEGNSVAILCRTNYDAAIPALALEIHHKYKFSLSSEQMTLNSPLPKKLMMVPCLFTERTTNNVKAVLDMVVGNFGKREVNLLMTALKNSETNGGRRLSVFTSDMKDLEYSAPSLVPFVTSVRNVYCDSQGNRVQGMEFKALETAYLYLKTITFKGTSYFCECARSYIDTILYVLKAKDYDTIFDFQSELQDIRERVAARVVKKGKTDKSPISIVTVHEFKGKEKDSTYVWNDSVNVFPPHKTNLSILEEVEEERRVHYIACTRAKKRNTVYTLIGKHGMFFDELDARVENPFTSQTVKIVNSSNTVPNKKLVASLNPVDTTDEIQKKLEGVVFNDALPI